MKLVKLTGSSPTWSPLSWPHHCQWVAAAGKSRGRFSEVLANASEVVLWMTFAFLQLDAKVRRSPGMSRVYLGSDHFVNYLSHPVSTCAILWGYSVTLLELEQWHSAVCTRPAMRLWTNQQSEGHPLDFWRLRKPTHCGHPGLQHITSSNSNTTSAKDKSLVCSVCVWQWATMRNPRSHPLQTIRK